MKMFGRWLLILGFVSDGILGEGGNLLRANAPMRRELKEYMIAYVNKGFSKLPDSSPS